MLRFILVALLFVATTALAQSPQPQGTPEVLALQAKIMQELSGNLQCNTQFIALQQKEAKLSADLAEAQAKIKKLEVEQNSNAQQKP